MSNETPYLSIVAASRNDDHGGNPLVRTQIFIDSFLEQCEKFKIKAELILIDWNPPKEKVPLSNVISWQKSNEYVDCKVITVPNEIHRTIRYSDRFPFYQMIAKNVGIRRAKGEFILATNIDILFSSELMEFISKKNLKKGNVYRCDRVDIDPSISAAFTQEEKMFYCKTESNIVRWNKRYTEKEVFIKSKYYQEDEVDGVKLEVLKNGSPFYYLNTFACGDFTMLHKDDWNKIKGYSEMESYSLHIDSMCIYSCVRNEINEVSFQAPLCCYHIEHSIGSGWTPEGEQKLYSRLYSMGVSIPDIEILHEYIDENCQNDKKIIFNNDDWGFNKVAFNEVLCDKIGINQILKSDINLINKMSLEDKIKPSGLIEYDWDILAQISYRKNIGQTKFESICYLSFEGKFDYNNPIIKKQKCSDTSFSFLYEFDLREDLTVDSISWIAASQKLCKVKLDKIQLISQTGEYIDFPLNRFQTQGLISEEGEIQFYTAHCVSLLYNVNEFGKIKGFLVEGKITFVDPYENFLFIKNYVDGFHESKKIIYDLQQPKPESIIPQKTFKSTFKNIFNFPLNLFRKLF